ncbi:MAG: hypothetical protein ACPIOQ_60345, partial [Promethearchaeia archaeon]
DGPMAGDDHVATGGGAGCILKPLADAATEHRRRKLGMSGRCEHNRQRRTCKECGVVSTSTLTR